MTRLTRGAVAAVVALVVGLFLAGPSLAASDPSDQPSQTATTEPQFGCLGETNTYGAPLPCQLDVKVLEPICDNDVPYLSYAVQAVGSPNTTVTITWVNPTDPGKSVVDANLPLKGRVLWPGAVVDAHGNPLDWPGWHKLADGTWAQGDEFDWVRPNVKVHFKVNPEADVTVAYPPSTPQCNDNPPTGLVLAATGSNDAKPILLAATGLVLAGGVAVTLAVVTRRRRREA